MNSKNITEFVEGDDIEGYYALTEATLRKTAKGKEYIRLRLADATGSIEGNMWDASQEIFQSLETGGVVKVRMGVESYRGNPQISLQRLRPATEDEVDFSAFVAVTPANIDDLKQELLDTIQTIEDEDYKKLLESVFHDEEIMNKFVRAPAAKVNHHAYIGGLLEHTMSIVRLADMFCKTSTTKLNRDLLLTGTLLHDLGKIEELGLGVSIDYTDIGSLLGHLNIGVLMVENHTNEISEEAEFPKLKKALIMHMILSHHGKFEYGSPVLPAIPEAFALHHLDNLDAKTIAARRMIDDEGATGNWTARSWMLDTRLFRNSDGTETTKETPAPKPAPKPAKQSAAKKEEGKKHKFFGETPSDDKSGGLFE